MAVAATLAFCSGNTDLSRDRSDGLANLGLGLRLAHGLDYGDSPGYHRREPLLPAAIALYDVGRGLLGLERLPVECLDNAEPSACRELAARYKPLVVAFLSLAAASVFILVVWITGSRALAWAGFWLTALSGTLLGYTHRFLTEVPAAGLLTLTTLLWLGTLRKRRNSWSFMLGLALAALVLTKVVFAYLWLPVGATLAIAGGTCGPGLRRFRLATLFLIAYGAVTGGWMLRNSVLAGHFGLVEKRAYKVLSVRASYNTMRTDEFWAGFAYYTPALNDSDLAALGFGRASFERFDTRNEDGFRRLGQKQYRARVCELAEMAKRRSGLVFDCEGGSAIPPTEISDQIRAEAAARIHAAPWKHMRASVLLAYRALFPEQGMGYPRELRQGRLAELWAMPLWPRFGARYGRAMTTVFNGATAAALLMVPIVLGATRRDWAGLILVLPVVYCHAVYALVSHFIPRYAAPEIPLRAAALCALAHVVASALGVGSARAGRSRDTSVPTPRTEG